MKVSLLVLLCSVSILLADSTIPPSASFGTSAISVSQSAGEVRIPVTVSGPPLADFFGTTVFLKVVEGTATWPRDVDTLNESLKFVTGETSKTLILGLPSTPAFAGTRTFTVRIGNGVDYNVGSPSTVTVTINGAYAEKPPVITTTTNKLSGGRVSVNITATDFKGRKTRRSVIVKPG